MKVGGIRVHCCLFTLECWSDHWRFGMPMRLHIGERFWTIPGLGGDRISQRIWDESEPVEIAVRKPTEGQE